MAATAGGRRRLDRGGPGPEHADRLPLHAALHARRTGGNGIGSRPPGRGAAMSRAQVPVGTPDPRPRTARPCSPTSIAPGMRVRLAAGGDGGFGNTRFKCSTNRAPRRTPTPVWPGEEKSVWLRLKLIADVGPGGAAQRRQVDLSRRRVGGAPEDRRLSVHHAAPPTWAWCDLSATRTRSCWPTSPV